MSPKGGWEDIDKACPVEGCTGMLQVKVLGATHVATRCTNHRQCGYEIRERIKK